MDFTGWPDSCLTVRTYFGTNFCFSETLPSHKLNSPSISLASVVSSPRASGCWTAFSKHPLKVGWHLAQLRWAWFQSSPGFDASWNARLASLPQAVMVLDTTASNCIVRGCNAGTGVKSYVWSTSQFTGPLREGRVSGWRCYWSQQSSCAVCWTRSA